MLPVLLAVTATADVTVTVDVVPTWVTVVPVLTVEVGEAVDEEMDVPGVYNDRHEKKVSKIK